MEMEVDAAVGSGRNDMCSSVANSDVHAACIELSGQALPGVAGHHISMFPFGTPPRAAVWGQV